MKRKNILDEMQEQKRLKIESNGFWFLFYGLTAAIIVQGAVMKEIVLRTTAGELIVLIALVIYIVPCYIKHGIWSTCFKPTFKTNFIISFCAGLVVGLSWGIKSYVSYGKLAGSIAMAVYGFGSTFVLCIALLTLCAWFYQRRVRKMEDAPESSDEKSH